MEALLSPSTTYWLENYGVWGLALVLFLCTYGFPFSKNIVIILCGFLVSQRYCSPLEAIVACSFGLFSGDISIYLLSRCSSTTISRFFPDLIMKQAFERARSIIQSNGMYVTVFSARFLPYVRTPIYLSAGMGNMGLGPFVFVDGASILLWVPLLIYIGWKGGVSIGSFGPVTPALLVGLSLVGTAYLAHRMWSNSKTSCLSREFQGMKTVQRVEHQGLDDKSH